MPELYIKKEDVQKMLITDTEGIVITKSLYDTIAIYSVEEFEKFSERLATIPREKHHIVRFFVASACDMKWDDYSKGFPISNLLLEYGKVVEGVDINIWTIGNKNVLYLSSNKENMQHLLETLLENSESKDTVECHTCVLVREENL